MAVNSRKPFDGFIYAYPHLYKMNVAPTSCRWCRSETEEYESGLAYYCPRCDDPRVIHKISPATKGED